VPITLPPRFGRADALVKAADLLLSGGADPDRADEPKRTGGDRVTVLVHLKENDLVGRSVVELEDGTRVSAETLRRMACDAGIVPVVLDDDSGNPLDIGRRTRANAGAVIDDQTCRSEWRGERLDLDHVVGVLM
jgi:hypothetical protein